MQKIKIGLLGYGKMGKAIEALAKSQGCEVVWRIGRAEQATVTPTLLQSADVVIEFSRPEVGFENVAMCLRAGVPVVSGTTGWQAELPAAAELATATDGAFLWASNFSIGVNLFFALNERLAQLMMPFPAYQPELTEIHHVHKLDAPSGTAVTLAERILSFSPILTGWGLKPHAKVLELPIEAIREGEVPGTHRIVWTGPVDRVTIEHEAFNRQGFALGALVAARWIVGKSGVFSMVDVLGI